MRVYLHEAICTLITGAQMSTGRLTRHDALILISLDGGEFVVETPGATDSANAVAIAPSVPHATTACTGNLIRLSIHMIHPRFPAVRALLKRPVTHLPREMFSGFDSRLQDASEGRLDAGAAGVLMNDLIEHLLENQAPARTIDPRVLWVMQQLEANIDHPFKDLASQLKLSQSRLSHLFSDHLGISLRGGQAWGRMALTWELLTLRPDLSLTQVAHIMGFSDSSHLSRAFKRRYGLTPTEYLDSRRVQIVRGPAPTRSRIPLPPSTTE
jgi:AraC-like DNA-binding protein